MAFTISFVFAYYIILFVKHFVDLVLKNAIYIQFIYNYNYYYYY